MKTTERSYSISILKSPLVSGGTAYHSPRSPLGKSSAIASFVKWGELFHDVPEKGREVLETYYHDIYHLFQKKLSALSCDSLTLEADKVKLKGLLDELIKVRSMLGESDSES